MAITSVQPSVTHYGLLKCLSVSYKILVQEVLNEYLSNKGEVCDSRFTDRHNEGCK
jgi:hypothetical protein